MTGWMEYPPLDSIYDWWFMSNSLGINILNVFWSLNTKPLPIALYKPLNHYPCKAFQSLTTQPIPIDLYKPLNHCLFLPHIDHPTAASNSWLASAGFAGCQANICCIDIQTSQRRSFGESSHWPPKESPKSWQSNRCFSWLHVYIYMIII